ncbi:MAG TPA: class I SAM-dependent methyltransferase [Rhabdochlamydiaceae bacterium]|jgi:predicted O-methyltransferase YrrM|nr:class I SAM-dependent methyltransferase [Rhabdochlamydiaceae bacterium]
MKIIFFASVLAFANFSIFANEPPALSRLDTYLDQRGFALSPEHSTRNEGYSSEAQRIAFKDDCRSMPDLKRVLEIGFNGGHSCETFLDSNQDVMVTSFDINLHPYAQIGVDFMSKKYLGRFQFVPGDSSVTINAYATAYPDEKFDLIFIDGCHEHNAAVKDIQNCQKLAHGKTVVWIDDYAPYGVQRAVDQCVDQGLLQILQVKAVNDHSGVRVWAIARYVDGK